jgi:hypothetical protein
MRPCKPRSQVTAGVTCNKKAALLKSIRVKYMSKFASLSTVMAIAAEQLNNCSGLY